MKNIKRLFEELEAAEKITDMIDKLFDEDPENEDLENAWNDAYNAEWQATMNLVNEIIKITNGLIDEITARKMLGMKRNELKALINAAA